jgi:hypothetical protein
MIEVQSDAAMRPSSSQGTRKFNNRTARLKAASITRFAIDFFPDILQFFFVLLPKKNFYLSPSVTQLSGTLASANKKQTDGPFRTLAAQQQVTPPSAVTFARAASILPLTLFFSKKRKNSVWLPTRKEVSPTGALRY